MLIINIIEWCVILYYVEKVDKYIDKYNDKYINILVLLVVEMNNILLWL